MVTASVAQRMGIPPMSMRRNARMIRPGLSGAWRNVGGRIVTLITGAKITATNHDATSAMATTANSENVYSPAVLRAKPIGTKPATVTRVPVSIGNAVDV